MHRTPGAVNEGALYAIRSGQSGWALDVTIATDIAYRYQIEPDGAVSALRLPTAKRPVVPCVHTGSSRRPPHGLMSSGAGVAGGSPRRGCFWPRLPPGRSP